jgi:hypothetical protein
MALLEVVECTTIPVLMADKNHEPEDCLTTNPAEMKETHGKRRKRHSRLLWGCGHVPESRRCSPCGWSPCEYCWAALDGGRPLVRLEMEGRPCWCEFEFGEAMAMMNVRKKGF